MPADSMAPTLKFFLLEAMIKEEFAFAMHPSWHSQCMPIALDV